MKIGEPRTKYRVQLFLDKKGNRPWLDRRFNTLLEAEHFASLKFDRPFERTRIMRIETELLEDTDEDR